MTSFKKEDRVSLKKNPAQKGVVDFVHPPQSGHQFYSVILDNSEEVVKNEHDLIPEVQIKTAWDLLANNALKDYQDFTIASTMSKVRNKTTNTISTLKASRTIFYPYQFIPLLKFLRSGLKRILIADEVGLGKTIEAGHILLEMAARGDLRNALVICTNPLRDKWKTELQEKFHFTFKMYEYTKEVIRDIRDDVNNSGKSILGILNYEKCRNEDLKAILEESGYGFDLVICDEAHSIRNSKTKQHKGVATIIDQSDAVVLLTATPIMTELENLQNLLKVLDQEAFGTKDIFNNAVRQNRPFVKALRRLNRNHKLEEVAEELHYADIMQEMSADEEVYAREVVTVADLFEDDQLYQRARANMLSGDDSYENKVRIQNDLIDLNSLNYIYSRTRKKNVFTNNVVTRRARTLKVNLTAEEWDLYTEVMDEYSDEFNIGLITKKRQISSSIPGYHSNKEELKKGIYNSDIPDSKFEVFEKILREVVDGAGKKLIVFAFFTNTLLYLQARLKEMGYGVTLIYGGVKDRTERIQAFKDKAEIQILLSSEVGSEGLDLQFCDALVNYDLPWNPMKVEQRIGRIDRVGQKSDVINIFNLVLSETIEERIHTRLYERIRLFEETLGDLEEILGETEEFGKRIERVLSQLYTTRLTTEETNQILEDIALAMEQEKHDLEVIQRELSDSFANDIHFQNEVENLTKNARYITKEELILYIESILRNELSRLSLVHHDENEAIIEIPNNAGTELFDFIEQYKDPKYRNPELDKLYRRFKKHFNESRIRITFDQHYAFEHKGIEYMSAFHPLINAITNYYQERRFDKNQAHQLSLQVRKVDAPIDPGFYLLVIYSISVNRDQGDGEVKKFEYLKTMLIDLNGDEAEVMDEGLAEQVYANAQMHAEAFLEDLQLDEAVIGEIRTVVSGRLIMKQEEMKQDEKIRFYSAIDRRANQELDYLEKRIQRIEEQLYRGDGIEAILEKQKKDFEEKILKVERQKQHAHLEVGHHLISLNLMHLYE